MDHSQDRRYVRVLVVVAATLTTTFLSKLLVGWAFTPDVWAKLFYVRWLLVAIFAGLWGAALLPGETHSLKRFVRSRPALIWLSQLGVLAAAAAVLVSCGDLAFEAAGTSAMGSVLKNEVIWTRAWVTSTGIVLAGYTLIFALTRRLATTLVVISPLYAGFAMANVLKVNYMDVAVHPLDLLRIPEFLPFFSSFIGETGVLAVIGGIGLWMCGVIISARTRPTYLPLRVRCGLGMLACAILLGSPFAFSRVQVSSSHWFLRAIGAPGRGFKEHARRHGVLLAFLSNLPAAFVSRPAGYSAASVNDALNRNAARADGTVQSIPRANLVLYLVESMMDPDDFGVRYTSDPIPTIRSLAQTSPAGWAIVPEAFGGSANTEFELLTGMSMCFVPRASMPYRQYLRHSIPSLPRALKQSGYRTTAIQADPKYFFGREAAYRMLGFDDVKWLYEAERIRHAERGSSPADAAVVDAILEASRQSGPFFIFAFPASTHAPYNQRTYRNSDLDVAEPIADEARSELQEYINALRVADREIARLIEHFRHYPTATMIVILGDHVPPLSSTTRAVFFKHLSRAPESEWSVRSRRVPLRVWANFPLPQEDLEFSTNVLASYLLRQLGVHPSEFFALNDAVRRTTPVLARGVADCGWGVQDERAIDPATRMLLADYELLQYDLLLGRNYSAAATQYVDTPTRK